jgi:O-acetylserine/cysteine efflux transporter
VLIFISFFGIILLGFDPLIRNEMFALILITLMAFFYASAQVFSRYLKDLEVTLTNAVMGLVGFMLLLISSSIFEGQIINEIRNISFQSWLLILHSGIFVSLVAHMSMFYLYRTYPVNRVFPFYALFPVFGILLTFLIFYEIPSMITIIGGLIVILSSYFINKEN